MAKTGPKAKPKNFSELKKALSKAGEAEIFAEANYRTSEELIKLFAKNAADLDALEEARKTVSKLEERVKSVAGDVEKIAENWLGSSPVLKAMAVSQSNQQRMRELAKTRASSKAGKPASTGRVKWSLKEAYARISAFSGIVAATELYEAFNTNNPGILAERLKAETGEFLRNETHEYVEFKLEPNHRLPKSDTRYRYQVNTDKVKARLKKAVEGS